MKTDRQKQARPGKNPEKPLKFWSIYIGMQKNQKKVKKNLEIEKKAVSLQQKQTRNNN